MKIKCKTKTYAEVMSMERPKPIKPLRQKLFWRILLRLLSIPELMATHFKVKKNGMEKLGKKEPCLVLMNHSCFLDLEIASTVLFPRRFNVVCTTDGFVGKNWLMRQLGCIPTKKFTFDISLVHNMVYTVKELKSSVLLFPEAGYSFDGTATVLPESLGQCVKMLGVPVIMIETHGAYARQPLFNNLKKRRVPISADVTYLLSPEEIEAKSAEEINEILKKEFSFDAFRWQKENNIRIDEPYRAEGLHRVLYKCPACGKEGEMHGEGVTLTCLACKKQYSMDEYGELHATEGNTEFPHIPDWFAWQRAEARRELESGSYRLDCAVDIYMMVDTKALFRVGEGRLSHDASGFSLVGCDGELNYSQRPTASYSLNADFYWYELGDVICIGNQKELYYCFPKGKDAIVAKTRLATEELYKIVRAQKEERRRRAKQST
ncbi:MAG: 1-acyl-sn-glycerol-3-phosphate acyltransferase [Clostridia bacterium]|nr:1-acyl-sn-glycerol-3-phosphate acyltransferase [Clostridia bacterium]